MNVQNILNELNKKFPGKTVVKNFETEPTEILCETEPTSEHPQYSTAVAVIDRSVPHFHKIMTEVYTVITGELTVHDDEKTVSLTPGQSYTIKPGHVHWAEGKETWIECRATPGWTKEDHILA